MMEEVLAKEETDLMPITVEESLQEQAEDLVCKKVAETAGQPWSRYDHDLYRILAQEWALDGIIQRVVSE